MITEIPLKVSFFLMLDGNDCLLVYLQVNFYSKSRFLLTNKAIKPLAKDIGTFLNWIETNNIQIFISFI